MSYLRRISRNLIFKILTEVIGRVLSFVFYVALARWLGEVAFGTFSLLYSVGSVVVFLVDPGLNLSLIRIAPRREGLLPIMARSLLGLKLALSALTVAVCAGYGVLAGYDFHMILLFALIGAQMAAFALSEFAGAIFQAREEMQYETFIMGIGKIVVTASAIGAVAFGADIAATLAVMTATQILAAAWALKWTSSRIGSLLPRFDYRIWKSLLREAIPLGAVTFFIISFYRIDVTLAPFLNIDIQSIGWYSAGVKILDVWLAVSSLAVAAVFPTFAVMAIKEQAVFVKWMNRTLAALALTGLGIGAGTYFYSHEILTIIFGANFAPASGALKWLGWALVFMFVRHGLLNGLILKGRVQAAFKISATALPLNVISNAALAPFMGIEGMAAAKLITDAFIVIVATYVWVKACSARPSRS